MLKAGKRIGVTSNSHHAINNLLAAVESRAQEEHFTFKGLKKSSEGEGTEFTGRCIQSIEDKSEFLDAWGPNISLTAGTAWLFADPAFTEQLDYLFIDEAGQVSVANLVTMGLAARNIVLMGDQMQLSQPVQGVHPGRSGDSILDYLLDGTPTIAPDRGCSWLKLGGCTPTFARSFRKPCTKGNFLRRQAPSDGYCYWMASDRRCRRAG